MELIVYYDEDYPTWWVSREVSKEIANFLKSKGFLEYNAEDLAKWMKKTIDANACCQSVVIFSQDIVPDTICNWKSPSSLIRTYLDCGGSVVWIGDTPFYYWGRRPSSSSKFKMWCDEKKKEGKLLEDHEGKIAEGWGRDGPFNILGVMPIYMDFPSSRVRFTIQGKSFALQDSWYGLRPILINASDRRKKNLTILARGSKPERPVSRKKVWLRKDKEENGIPLQSIWSELSKLIGLTPAFISLISALYTFSAGFPPMVSLTFFTATIACSVAYALNWFFRSKEILVSAWLRNYDDKHPTSGFLRIWDCHLDRITDKMLGELYNVILARIEMRMPKNSRK